MSAAQPRRPEPDDEVDEYPTFELEYAYDDRECPAEVTLFSTRAEDDLVGAWLSADVDTAVPLERTR